MSDPRRALGIRRTSETLSEILVPLTIACGSWYAARVFLGRPVEARSLAGMELFLLLGAVTATVSWYIARQLSQANVRRPWYHVMWSGGVSFAALYGLSRYAVWDFQSVCELQGGVLVEAWTTTWLAPAGLADLLGWPIPPPTVQVCRIGGVQGNPYLPGTLLRAPWDGAFSIPLAAGLAVVSVLTAVGTRDVRLFPTRLGMAMANVLRLAPAAGDGAVVGSTDDPLQACGNTTLWGEPCGQLYGSDQVFEPGEWCVRCAQVYRPAERRLQFRVVSLFTAEIDVLNGLERLDAVSWPQGETMPPDARLSGQERWVQLGTIDVPDVVSVATLLQLVHDRLDAWAGEASEEAKPAFDLAKARASRIAAWIWIGSLEHRLTYARPTNRCMLSYGPVRLRDLGLEIGEPLVLQLDIGLLPLEMRTGFRQTFMQTDREPVLQNLKQDLWVPTTSLRKPAADGLWVPRVEGDALRAWLSLDRLRPDEARGVSSPRPYVPRGDAPASTLEEGTVFDFVRAPLHDNEPTGETAPGASIAEWAWMEDRVIELLRQESLVLVAHR